MSKTRIEWTDQVWNPITGCSKVSEGCRNCYADRMAKRLAGRYGYPADGPFRVTLHSGKLQEPLKWKKPQRIFICSMGDWMHENISPNFIDEILDIIDACPQHIFFTLTKRPQNLQRKLYGKLPPNLWLGVSVEDQKTADARIPILQDIEGQKKFISVEPLLGPVNLCDLEYNHLSNMDLVIAGCESGPGRRPAKVGWFRDIKNQCLAAKVPFFLKQMEIDGKVVHMPELDGKVWREWPEGELI